MCDRVAIIEKGQLLAVGTVDEILHGRGHVSDGIAKQEMDHSKHVVILVRMISDAEQAAQYLQSEFQIRGPTVSDQTIEFDFINDMEAHADLLKAMVDRGFRVARFSVKERSLEDAFLHVTKGIVQ